MSKLPPHWLKDAQATLLLNKFAQVEVERLTEKKRLIALWAFDERERASDLAWRNRNKEIYDMAIDLMWR